MLSGPVIILVSLAYVGLLFAVAWWGDRRAAQGRSLVRNPWVYTLSIAVYCTSWTFYGAVGSAARHGVEFLTIYLGPTIVFLGWWVMLRKMLRISKTHRITSIADFISSRYGKSTRLSMMVTLIAVIGTTPYIALQLKAVATSFTVLTGDGGLGVLGVAGAGPDDGPPILSDTGFWVALTLAAFAILFGTRHIDADEHHEGVVAAIAFESLVKLLALLSVGVFVTFFLFNGFTDLFADAAARAATRALFTFDETMGPRWITLTLLSMAAVLTLPRQFQMIVVENVDERHLATASWLFPAYLLVMNLFVLPIALAGLSRLPAGSDPDFFVLTVPLFHGHSMLALVAYVGGLSAATSMVIVIAIALSTMVCNDLVVPALLRIRRLRLPERADMPRLLLRIRRFSILLIVALGYSYYWAAGTSDALAAIGLMSFEAAAQFLPVMVGGLFWRGGTKHGAMAGLTLGFTVWAYTMLLPSLARSGWLDLTLIEAGPWGIALLRPEQLFGLGGMEPLTHTLAWSMLLNGAGYVLVSVLTEPRALERIQAALFVDAFRRPGGGEAPLWRSTASADELYDLAQRFVGYGRAYAAFQDYARVRGVPWRRLREADADMLAFVERLLAGSIGSASARAMVASVAKGAMMSLDEVMAILHETSQVIEHSHQLERTAAELRAANERLKELDRLKDDFLSVVSHEFRTPLTSIRSFSEILVDNPDLDPARRDRFLSIIARESERLTRLIEDHLDLVRLEVGHSEWRVTDVDPRAVIEEAIAALGGVFSQKGVEPRLRLADGAITLRIDRDRLMQVIVNLLSNAAKFCAADAPRVEVVGRPAPGGYLIEVSDNGPGVAPSEQRLIFDKFARSGEGRQDRPTGSGLGLAISRQVVEHFGGRIWVDSSPGAGSRFCVLLPIAATTVRTAGAVRLGAP
ncbi:MAG: ATP-binding protein [Acetobacteraceae bacterium]